ncbi:GlxA family transcriptional regulator [Marinomonas colpomeniae]|nr:helix-turn-helix domain-containing protein [Marinomonas colpomeniae]
MMTSYKFAIIHYPNSLLSAVYGFSEMFTLANRLCQDTSVPIQLDTDILTLGSFDTNTLDMRPFNNDTIYHAILIPPSMDTSIYESNVPELTNWLNGQHQSGAILCSACAGAFFLATTNATENYELTTHWSLADIFKQRFPNQKIDISKILIDQGDIISAGGMMSWMDLGLALVQRFTQASIVRQLGKTLVMDTGRREQSYYQEFTPCLDHGDRAILSVQHHLQGHFSETNPINILANIAHLTPRTFLRRFQKHTGWNPSDYIQRLRIQRTCNDLEETTLPFESIALQVGYKDAGNCRKAFRKIMGLTPSEFRKRFILNKLS